MRVKLFFLISFLITTLSGNQNPYILTHDGLIDQRAQEKIFEIGKESKEKLGVNLYIDIKENNGIDPSQDRDIRQKIMKEKEKELISKVQEPYVILTLSIDQL